MKKASNQFGNRTVDPQWQNGSGTLAVALVANQILQKGQLLGQVSAANQNERQQLAAVGVVTGGTYRLNYLGSWTGTLAYNANAATIQAALEATENLEPGDVKVTGTGPWVIEFQGGLANSPQPLLLVESGVTGPPNQDGSASSYAITRTQSGVSNGKWAAYAPGATDGRQIAKLVLSCDAAVDHRGTITYGKSATGGEHGEKYSSVKAYYSGVFSCAELLGLDNGAVTALGKIVSGSSANGLIYIR